MESKESVRNPEKHNIRLSKALSWLLRHHLELTYEHLEDEMCASMRISENLQEQEDEMTALTEIIGDVETFYPIDFTSSTYIHQIQATTYVLSEAEKSFTSNFFERMIESNKSGVENVQMCTKTYRHGGTMRISPDLQHVLGNDSSSINHVNIKCQSYIKNNSDSIDSSDSPSKADSSHIDIPDNHFNTKVKHLPPIVLNFALPPSYPSDNPPIVDLFCSWLNKEQLSQLKESMLNLWKDSGGSVILFTWQSFLQDESLTVLEPFEIPSKTDNPNTCSGLILDISQAVKEKLLQFSELISRVKELDINDQPAEKSSEAQDNSLSTIALESRHSNHTNGELQRNRYEAASSLKSIHANKESVRSNNFPKKQKFYGIIEKYFDQKGYGFIRIFGDGLKRVNIENLKPKRVRGFQDKSRQKSKFHQSNNDECSEYWWDVYFHLTGLKNSKASINQGVEVEFDLVDSDHQRNISRETSKAQNHSFKTDKNKRCKAINIEAIPPKQIIIKEPEANLNSTVNSLQKTEAESESKLTKSNIKCDKEKNEINCVMNMVKYFEDYNELEEEKQFNANVYLCLVCFTEKLGIKCMKFPICNHVYCSDCMKSYFQVQIGEGMMSNLVCPNDSCESRALPTQVIINVTKM